MFFSFCTRASLPGRRVSVSVSPRHCEEMVGELPGLYELPPKEAAPGTENSGRNRELSMRGANRELSAAAKAQRGLGGD